MYLHLIQIKTLCGHHLRAELMENNTHIDKKRAR